MANYFMRKIFENSKKSIEKITNFFVNYVFPIILLIETLFNLILKKRKINISNKSRNNIIIVGGSLANKGAQAMTFTVVDQIRRRFPNKEFYLFSVFESEKFKSRLYKFNIIPWTYWHRILFSNIAHKYLVKILKPNLFENKLEKILRNAELMIDISGYRLSSQFDQSDWKFYILDIIIAKKYKIPYLIFPQSIGPFNFSLLNKVIFNPLAKYYLKYPKIIFYRENDGLRYLSQFKNIYAKKSFDLAIQKNDYNLSNIFREKVKIRNYDILPNSVCIIPNSRVIERIEPERIFKIYTHILKKLIKANKNIYVLRHSKEDLEICVNIKNLLKDNENIFLILDDLNVIEIENLIKNFDFVIASRYHSIIHAYKHGIPAIVIGWAVKYSELMSQFNQLDYYCDIRSFLNVEIMDEILEKLMNNRLLETKKIEQIFNILSKKRKCFEIIDNLILKNFGKLNIEKTVELDLCVSCEICKSVCPTNAISMRFSYGKFIPEINKTKCNMCSKCFEICPGIDIFPFNLMKNIDFMDIIKENVIECFTGFSKNTIFRKAATSGGLITNLVIELIENKEYDAAFILNFQKFNDKPARLEISNNIDEIIESAGSKYIPASVYNIIEILKKKDNKKFIIIGTSCQILGIKKFINNYNISEKNLLFLGLFCNATLNFNFLKYVQDLYSKSKESIFKFCYRTKEKYGWPGHSKIIFNSGRSLILDRNVRISLKKYFNLKRCLFCFDKLNRLSDISFGDCYIQEKQDKEGISNIIIRTRKGKEIRDSYGAILDLKEENLEKILISQNIKKKYNGFLYARNLAEKESNVSLINNFYKINYVDRINLILQQYYLGLGQKYKRTRILIGIILTRLLNMLNPFLKHIIK